MSQTSKQFYMMMQRHVLTLLLCLGLVPLLAQMKTIDFERYTLDNGLTVLLHEDHSTPIVNVTVLYHVGSKNENPQRTGFAHFFEHLMFEGSENIDRGEFANIIEKNGGALNAYTTNDRTVYYETLPSNQLELGLWLESERMLHAIVDEEGVETQREVVKEERRQRIDNQPYGRFTEEMFKRAFQEHPYRWPVIGSMDHLNAATEADYQQFYNDFYVPNNAVLSISGDIDIKDTRALVEKYFSTIPRGGDIDRDLPQEPMLAGEIRDTVYDNVQLPGLFMGYRTPALGTDDYYALEMLNKVLSDGGSSRLNRALVEEEQVAVAAFAQNFGLEDPGIAIVASIANMGVDPQEMEKVINAEMERVRTELVSEEEFQKVRNQIENDLVYNMASMSGIAENLAVYEAMYGDAGLINNEIDRYLAVTREEMREVAQKYYANDNRVVLYWLAQQNKQ